MSSTVPRVDHPPDTTSFAMEDTTETQPLLRPDQGIAADRRASVVSFAEVDSGNPKEWSAKYRWFSVVLLCGFAAIVYVDNEKQARLHWG